MKLNAFLTLTILACLLTSFVSVYAVYAQGSSLDTAEDVTNTGGKSCVYIGESESHYYKYYASGTVTIYMYPSDNLDADLQIMDSNGNTVGGSYNGAGHLESFTVTYNGYIYIRVFTYSGYSGYYNLKINEEPPDPDTVCSSSSGGGGGGGGGSGGCGCDVCHLSCSIPGLNWDPCCALCNVVCAIHSAVVMVQNFLGGIADAIRSFGQAVLDTFNAVWNGICGIFGAIRDFFAGIANTLVSIGQSIANAVTSAITTIGNAINFVISSVAGFLQSVANAVASAFGAAGEAVANGLRQVGVSLSPASDWLAHNWLAVLGVALIIAGIFTYGILSIIGVFVLIGYAITTGQLPWPVVLVAAGILILALAVRR